MPLLKVKKTINLLLEFSIPLLIGIVLALIWANIDYSSYKHFIKAPLVPGKIFGQHTFNLYFIMNDIFMVFFFGIATVEIVQALRPGGSLVPIRRALNPFLSAIGGVVLPALVFLLACKLLKQPTEYYNGWGITTATDIAIAWLVIRLFLGSKHPAVTFLLLIAIIDDAIGLGIIAIFYPDPEHAVQLQWLFLILLGMALSYGARSIKINSFGVYILLGIIPCWIGLMKANLHPALAAVFVVPFLPTSRRVKHSDLFEEEKEKDETTLANFEHFFKKPVDIGLLGFGLVNAGVVVSSVSSLSFLIFGSLLVGKTIGISLVSVIAHYAGITLPKGMSIRSLIIASLIAGIGLTVSLFIAGQAFSSPEVTASAKMGALLSIFAVIPAFLFHLLTRSKKL